MNDENVDNHIVQCDCKVSLLSAREVFGPCLYQ